MTKSIRKKKKPQKNKDDPMKYWKRRKYYDQVSMVWKMGMSDKATENE